MEENSSLVTAKELISLMKIFYRKIFSYLSGVVDRMSEFDISKDVIILGGISMLGFYGLADVISIFGVVTLNNHNFRLGYRKDDYNISNRSS